MNGWIGVDLDGTLAVYDGWVSAEHIGEPIWTMVNRVKEWLAKGKDVRIFTARLGGLDAERLAPIQQRLTRVTIENWCERYVGRVLPITATKDFGMVELWDDRCVQLIPNTGMRADGKS